VQPPRFSFSGGSFAMLFGALWLAVGLIFLPIGLTLAWHEYQRSTLIPEEGALAPGMVLTKTVDSRSKNSDPYSIEFRFTTQEGKLIKGRAKVSREEWNLLNERGMVKVGYLPGNPEINRVPGQVGDSVAALIFSLVGGVFSLLGAVIFGFGFARSRRNRQIVSTGTAAQAHVDEVSETNFSVNGVRQVTVHYTFKDAAGREVRGKSMPMSPEQGELWKRGDRGAVRFDARSPQKSVWLGKEQA
jgi:hypothetical protein